MSVCAQDECELERQLEHQTVLCNDAERRAERSQLDLAQLAERVDSLNDLLQQRQDEYQQQSRDDHTQVCRVLICFLVADSP